MIGSPKIVTYAKHLLNILLLMQLCFTSVAQSAIIGKYGINNNKEIYLNLDSDMTFTYGWRGHMWKDTSSGHFTLKGDTIFLTFRPFRQYTGFNKEQKNVFYPEVLSAIDRPDTLLYSNDKLYRIKSGHVLNMTKREKVNFIKTKGWQKYYRRKYYLFGSYISKRRRIHYLDKFG